MSAGKSSGMFLFKIKNTELLKCNIYIYFYNYRNTPNCYYKISNNIYNHNKNNIFNNDDNYNKAIYNIKSFSNQKSASATGNVFLGKREGGFLKKGKGGLAGKLG